jgi:hypothetical protein
MIRLASNFTGCKQTSLSGLIHLPLQSAIGNVAALFRREEWQKEFQNSLIMRRPDWFQNIGI